MRIEHRPAERVRWEVFRGHLLDPAQTREERTLESWQVLIRTPGTDGEEPLLAVRFDPAAEQLYVTRSIQVYGWEAYEEAGVILSRETRKWNQELVGTIALDRLPHPDALGPLLEHSLTLAVVGTSRLPITSLESPLPAYTLGQVGYLPARPGADEDRPLRTPRELVTAGLTAGLPPWPQAKLLELALRAVAKHNEVPEVTHAFVQRWRALGQPIDAIPALVRTLFNHVALSPDTGFVHHLVKFLLCLKHPEYQLGTEPVVDTFSFLLRHLARHLTAYDLETFHNFGANYPDALSLDLLLRAYLGLVEQYPGLFTDDAGDDDAARRAKRVRRRALRQGWLLRRYYEGLPVPDLPTSPGENLRVLPEPFVRLPEEQIVQPRKRRKRLYDGQPADGLLSAATRGVLHASLADLDRPEELRELGMGVYLDRPLGVFKRPGEVDRTPMLSYEAFSHRIVRTRVEWLERWGLITADRLAALRRVQAGIAVKGVLVTDLQGQPRPGVVSLEEARQAGLDVTFLRTTASSLRAFLAQYDWAPLHASAPAVARWLAEARRVLLIRSPRSPARLPPEPLLTLYDDEMQPRLELGVDLSVPAPARYAEHAGVEYLVRGLRLLRVWEQDAAGRWGLREVSHTRTFLPPRMTDDALAATLAGALRGSGHTP